jgi:hypothetical protein
MSLSLAKSPLRLSIMVKVAEDGVEARKTAAVTQEGGRRCTSNRNGGGGIEEDMVDVIAWLTQGIGKDLMNGKTCEDKKTTCNAQVTMLNEG